MLNIQQLQLKKDFEQYASHTCEQIKHICTEIGPREAGSTQELDAQKFMGQELERIADKVDIEEYIIHRKAFLGFIPFTVIFMICAILVYWKNKPMYSLILTLIASIPMIFEFVLYYQFSDLFFPSQTSHNLIATMKPSGPIKRRIVLSGHADSQYEWLFVYLIHKYTASVVLMPCFFGIGLCFLASSFEIVLSHLLHIQINGQWSIVHNCILVVLTCCLPSIFAMFFFWNPFKCVPGANDNLTGCYTAMSIMNQIKNSGIKLKNTELVVLITGSEEVGLRGAKAYVQKHKKELHDVPTLAFALDTFHDYDDITIYNYDLNGLCKLDEEACNILYGAAHSNCGLNIPFKSVPIGATDAVAFAQSGIQTAAFCAMNLGPPRWYHTRLDTADNLEPKTLALCMEICYHATMLFDDKGFNDQSKRYE